MQVITEERSPQVTVLFLAGRMDAGNAGEFNTAFGEVLEKRPPVLIINMEKLEYISSAGLRSTLTLIKGAKAAGTQLRFCAMQPMVADVFNVSGFSAMLSIFATLVEAQAVEG